MSDFIIYAVVAAVFMFLGTCAMVCVSALLVHLDDAEDEKEYQERE